MHFIFLSATERKNVSPVFLSPYFITTKIIYFILIAVMKLLLVFKVICSDKYYVTSALKNARRPIRALKM